MGRRFLRPRGDAPLVIGFARALRAVPPPTRRCADWGAKAAGHYAGSSAHAEMRRRRHDLLARHRRFLRPRGDAPVRRPGGRVPRGVPPPTRRCAPRRGRAAKQDPGSSAHAEMRLRRVAGLGVGQGFLRPRGDAPAAPRKATMVPKVPPPTRRCAPHSGAGEGAELGSSAHAEMRRSAMAPGACARRFLRPRGDAPRDEYGDKQTTEVPPPTRRCAPPPPRAPPPGAGSSAHAEMRLGTRLMLFTGAGFLRPRGDAPPRERRRCR